MMPTRRDFIAAASSLGAAGFLGIRPTLAEQVLPESTSVRFAKIPGICVAPQYVVDELLRAEGIPSVSYVAVGAGEPGALAVSRGEIDFSLNFVSSLLALMDRGEEL